MTVFKLIKLSRAKNNAELHFSLHSTAEKAMLRVAKEMNNRKNTGWKETEGAHNLKVFWTRDWDDLDIYWYISEVPVD